MRLGRHAAEIEQEEAEDAGEEVDEEGLHLGHAVMAGQRADHEPAHQQQTLFDDSTSASTDSMPAPPSMRGGAPISAAPPALTSTVRLAIEATPASASATTMAGTSMMASSAGDIALDRARPAASAAAMTAAKVTAETEP